MTEEVKKTKKKKSFLKEKIILKLIFTTYYNKKLNELWELLVEAEEVTRKRKELYLEKLKKVHFQKNRYFKLKIALFFKRILGLRKEKAFMFNDNGEVEEIVDIMPTENTFKYADNEYIIERKEVKTKVLVKRILEIETFYFYNINNATALTIGTPLSSVAITPKVLHAIMESEHLIKLNKPKNSLSALLEGKGKWVLLIGLGVVAYLMFGGA